MADPEAEPTASSHELVRVRAAETAGSRSLELFDAAVGVAYAAVAATAGITRGITRVVRPLGRTVLHPPLVPAPMHPARLVNVLADRGRSARISTGGDLERLVEAMIPVLVREVLDTLDLDAIIVERINLDGLVATVDIADVLDRLDMDAIVQRVDMDAIVDRIDVNAIVQRVDMDAIVDRIDVDAIVQRVDMDAIVAAVDLAAVIDRVNVVGIAEDVINEIDLPEIIRNSTGSMASQVVRDARMQSIGADEAVSQLIDRLLRRRGSRSTIAPHQPVVPQPRAHDEEPLQ